MASEEKFVHEAMANMLRHNDRMTSEPSNVDIDPSRSHLNYSFELDHGGLTDYKYYKQLIDSKYIYGRGSKREDQAVTGCGWVVTAPKEICGDPVKEREFFQGVFNFVSDRYGKENIINNAVHYDEAGEPHIHIIFCPVTKLDHDKVQYKTIKTKEAVRLESGRYEFGYKFKLDENGQKIPLKNYSRMSDYYDEKISANDVLNKIELKNFHYDLQKYLDANGIEGRVITGKTGGVNFTVKELKEFTAKTGLRLDEVKEMQGDRTLLESYVEQHAKVADLEVLLSEKNAVIESLRDEIMAKDKTIDMSSDMKDKILHKDKQIQQLTQTITDKDRQIVAATDANLEMQHKLHEMEQTLSAKQQEIDRASITMKDEILQRDARISELSQSVSDKERQLAAARNSNIEMQQKVTELEQSLTAKDRDIDCTTESSRDEVLLKIREIDGLRNEVSDKDRQITAAKDQNIELQRRIREMERSLSAKQQEIDRANERIAELETEKKVEASRTEQKTEATRTDKEQGWGRSSGTWGDRSQTSGWGTRNTDIVEEKTW